MESISAFTSAHPTLWLVILAVVGLVVLRALARLACLATLVIGFIILAGFGAAVMKGLA